MKTRSTRTLPVVAFFLMIGIAHAATNIVSGGGSALQTAIDSASEGDILLVSPGIYSPITSNNKRITIESTDGAEGTIIDGGGTQRCATLGTDFGQISTVLTGFKLKNGRVVSSSSPAYGGGVYGGTLNSCTLTDNTAFSSFSNACGGGTCHSTLNNCTLAGNTVSSSSSSSSYAYGGGAYNSILNNCTLTGNTVSSSSPSPSFAYGGGAYNSILNNCTLTGNTVSSSSHPPAPSYAYGGGTYGCTVNNCMLTENMAELYGGGVCASILNNCTLMKNTAFAGAGADGSTLDNCTLVGNSAHAGGGARYCTLNNCTLMENTAEYDGGGAFLCTLNNCTLTSNSANAGGGACECTLNNCTVYGNVAEGYYYYWSEDDFFYSKGSGGGVSTCNVFNSIVWGNSAEEGSNWYDNEYDNQCYEYSCMMPLPDGVGNIASAPMFVDAANMDFRLKVGSPCIDKGNNHYVEGDYDLDGKPRIYNGTVDMGAYEWGPCTTWHVNAMRFDDSGTGRGWITAKKTIQAAIDLAIAGDTIVVTNGIYEPFSTDNKTITIQSVNGAEYTIIDGGKTNRCATMGSAASKTNTVLVGFTLRNGNGRTSWDGGGLYYYYDYCGGGARGGTLKNCTLTGNTAMDNSGAGGGAYYSVLDNCTLSANQVAGDGGGASVCTLNACTLTGNVARNGGGANDCVLRDCVLTGNTADSDGGGAYGCTLDNCTLTENRADYGAGVYGGTLNNGTLIGNVAHFNGGGAYGGSTLSCTLNNCVLWKNSVEFSNGGGAYGCTLNNCTVVGNTAPSTLARGGGTYGSYVYNSIVWGNTASSTGDNCGGITTVRYTCTTEPLPIGTGNTSSVPCFVNAEVGDFRLQGNSPCIDVGSNGYAVGELDLDGKPRMNNEKVDMGAYEYVTIVKKVTLDGWGNFTGIILPHTLTCINVYNGLPTKGTRTGYTFGGWFTEPSGGTKVTASTILNGTEDQTLYARWTANTLTVSLSSLTLGASAESQTFSVSGNVSWTVTNNTTWLTISPTSGSDGGTVMVMATANTSTESRNATITVTGGGITNTIIVTQAAAATHTITTVPSPAAGGGTSGGGLMTGGSSCTVTATANQDYAFSAWKENGATVSTSASYTFTVEGNRTLIAIFRSIGSSDPYLSDSDGVSGTAPTATTAYAGFVYDADNTVRGTLALSAKMTLKKGVESWTFTAKAVLQNASVSFSGKGDAPGDILTLETKGGERLSVTLGAGAFYGTIEGGKVGTTQFNVVGARDAFADKKDATGAAGRLNDVRGYYTAALIDGADGTAGYITLTVGNSGSVKLGGKLADGTAVSGSAKLLEGLNDQGWLCIALHKPLYSKKGRIGGLLWLSPSDKMLRVDTASDWYIDWSCADAAKAPGKTALARGLDICGGWYGDGRTGAALAPSYLFSADVPALPPLVAGLSGGMWMSVAFPQDVPVTATGGKLSIDKGVAPKKDKATGLYDYTGFNPATATISYTAKTGIFKGGFKLYYAGDGARGFQHKAASVSYAGVHIPTRDAAYGAWPKGLGSGTVKIGQAKVEIPVKLE